jgi:hypothetical protein
MSRDPSNDLHAAHVEALWISSGVASLPKPFDPSFMAEANEDLLNRVSLIGTVLKDRGEKLQFSPGKVGHRLKKMGLFRRRLGAAGKDSFWITRLRSFSTMSRELTDV